MIYKVIKGLNFKMSKINQTKVTAVGTEEASIKKIQVLNFIKLQPTWQG